MARRRPKKSVAAANREKRTRARLQRAALAGDERARWLARHAEYQRQRRARLAPEELALQRQKNAVRNRLRRAALSPESLERLRRQNRERARRRRDRARCDLPLDAAAARPDLFASVGLRRRQRAAAKARTEEASEECVRHPLVHEPDHSVLLSSVQVELVEGLSESELDALGTGD